VVQRFSDHFEPAHGAHRAENVRGVAALPSAALQQTAPWRQVEDSLEQPALGSMHQQARAELAQDGVVKAGVNQLQAKQVFPVNSGADRVGGLPIGQPFHELQQRCERKADWRLGRLFAGRKQVREVAILDVHVQLVVKPHHRIAVRKKIARATSAVWPGTLYVRFALNEITHPGWLEAASLPGYSARVTPRSSEPRRICHQCRIAGESGFSRR